MLKSDVSISSTSTTQDWWQYWRPRLILLYLALALALLLMSGAGHLRILSETGKTFGGFFWAIVDGKLAVVSVPSSLPSFEARTTSLTTSTAIAAVNHQPVNQPGKDAGTLLSQLYATTQAGTPITYTISSNDTTFTITRPTVTFTVDMWWQSYGLTLLAGFCWLMMGGVLLAGAKEWTGAVEGITLLPPAMLFLLYSHWGNVQQASTPDIISQLLWVPSFALLGAAFIHLSLTYRPRTLNTARLPQLTIDALPYLPLLALCAYEWSSYLLFGHVSVHLNLILSLGYGVIGGLISFYIGIVSLLRVGRLLPRGEKARATSTIPVRIRRRVGDLFTLWIGAVGLGLGLGLLPLLLLGAPLLPLPIFYVLAAVYPFVLFYAIRSLRLIERLEISIEQRDDALREQQQNAEALYRSNDELKQAQSLLLRADAHLRSLLSQRIHDQPKQQALRIRSLLGHWQHKLRIEAERDPAGRVAVQPIVEALGKVRKISEELEDDLRGLQLLVEDAYQRRSLGLKLHLEKLIREDLPALHPESQLKIQANLWALDTLNPDLEQTAEGEKLAEAVSYTITQALLNIYNHAGATFATIRTLCTNSTLDILITDDGRGFDPGIISPEKTSLFKARLKAREIGGSLTIASQVRPHSEHGTVIHLHIPLPPAAPAPPGRAISGPLPESEPHNILGSPNQR